MCLFLRFILNHARQHHRCDFPYKLSCFIYAIQFCNGVKPWCKTITELYLTNICERETLTSMRRPKCCLHIYTGCFFCFVWKACNQMSFCAWFITFLCHNMIDIPTLLIILIFIDLLCRVKTVFSVTGIRAGVMDGWSYYISQKLPGLA